MDEEHTGIRVMDEDMLAAHRHYQKSQKFPNESPFGKTVTIYLPAHGDMNCPCYQCTLCRLSQGTQPIWKITLPPINVDITTDKNT